MKRAKIIKVLLVLLLVFSLSIKLTKANPVRLITIQSDGSVVPQTEYVKQEGNVYYLTQSLSPVRLVINCSNIVFDGQGYTINGSEYFVLGGNGITLENVNNVTIRDVIVVSFYEPSIYLSNCSDVTILRVQTDAKAGLVVDISGSIYLEESNDNKIINCDTGVRVQSGSSNTIYGNNVTLLINSSNNLIYFNNINVNYYVDYYGKEKPYPIVQMGASFNRWDNGTYGNYWSSYNGQGVYELDGNNIDHHPLTQRVDVPSIISTPTATPYLPPRNAPHLELIDYLLPISVIMAIIIVLSLLLYRRHRKTAN